MESGSGVGDVPTPSQVPKEPPRKRMRKSGWAMVKEIPLNDHRLTNKCEYECCWCPEFFASYFDFALHGRKVHQRGSNKLKVKRTYTTFLACQLCQKYLYCDTQFLQRHLSKDHLEMTLTQYCGEYEHSLAGVEDEEVADAFLYVEDKFDGLTYTKTGKREIKQEASEVKEVVITEPDSSKTKNVQEFSIYDHLLANTCAYECGWCAEPFASYSELIVHGKRVHNKRKGLAKFRRTHTTFLQCAICQMYVYCDAHFLQKHLYTEHFHVTITQYCGENKDSLVGAENEDVAQAFLYVDDKFRGLTYIKPENSQSKEVKKEAREEGNRSNHSAPEPAASSAIEITADALFSLGGPLGTTETQILARGQTTQKCEKVLANKCVYQCNFCPVSSSFANLEMLQLHEKLKHNAKYSKPKRIHTTFLQCQLCDGYIFCDIKILSAHLREFHPTTAMMEYYSKYTNFLTGEESEQLKRQFKGSGMYRAIHAVLDRSVPPLGREGKLSNVCLYLCGICRKSCINSFKNMKLHYKKEHPDSGEIKFKRTRETFLQCQDCRKFLFCDNFILDRHVFSNHKSYNSLSEYCAKYCDDLEGQYNERLSEQFRTLNHFRAIPMEKLPAPKPKKKGRTKKGRKVREFTLSPLHNRCTFKCGVCQDECLSFSLLRIHTKEKHGKPPSETSSTKFKTTFVQCQLCLKYLYCEGYAMSRHLRQRHNLKTLAAYSKEFPKHLMGVENEKLARYMKDMSIEIAVNMPADDDDWDHVLVNGELISDNEDDEVPVKVKQEPVEPQVVIKEERSDDDDDALMDMSMAAAACVSANLDCDNDSAGEQAKDNEMEEASRRVNSREDTDKVIEPQVMIKEEPKDSEAVNESSVDAAASMPADDGSGNASGGKGHVTYKATGNKDNINSTKDPHNEGANGLPMKIKQELIDEDSS